MDLDAFFPYELSSPHMNEKTQNNNLNTIDKSNTQATNDIELDFISSSENHETLIGDIIESHSAFVYENTVGCKYTKENVSKILDECLCDKSKFITQFKKLPSTFTGNYLATQLDFDNCEERDILVCEYIETFIRMYPNESQFCFIDGINKRLGDLRKNYYERGCRIMSLITNIDSNELECKNIIDTNLCVTSPLFNQEKYLENLRKDIKTNLQCKKPEKLKKYMSYTPRSIQECQNNMRKNKYVSITRLSLYYIPILIPRTTKRLLDICSTSLFETFINLNEDRIEDLNTLKINAVTSLIIHYTIKISHSVLTCIEHDSFINRTVAILSLINCIDKLEPSVLIDILEKFCNVYKPNKISNDIALLFVNKCSTKFQNNNRVFEICSKFINKINTL